MTSELTPSQEPKLSFSSDDFAKALEQYDYEFQPGQVVRGKVVEHGSEGAYVDIGGKSPAFVSLRDAALQSIGTLAEVLPLQQEIDFLIVKGQDAEGQVTLSRRQLLLKQAWDNLAQRAEQGTSVQMRVTGTNKGGVIGEVEGLRGFIPRSHLLERNDLDALVGQQLTATFLEVNPEQNKLVLSQRDAARSAVISKLERGQLVEGTVASIKPYGVFVNLGEITGLLHIAQVSNTRVNSLETLFTLGQPIKTMIVDLDEANNRISLSTKVLENYPGEILEKLDEIMASASDRAEKARGKLS